MWLRKTVATLLGAAALCVGVTATSEVNAEEMTIGTLAPQNSPWGKVFTAWAAAVDKKSDGALTINWFFNGVAGDEDAMVDKMRGGQLDGAAVTSVGLGKIHRPVLALQAPGLFDNWAKLDEVRAQMLPRFLLGMSGEGFQLLGVGDVGLARTFSNKPIRTPADLTTRKVYAMRADDVGPVAGAVMGYTPVPESVVTLKSALSTGRIDTLTVPALPLVQLQWHTHVTHASASVSGVGIGGLVFSKASLDGLPADLRTMFASTGGTAGRMLTQRIRKEDENAWNYLQGTLEVVTLTDAEKQTWQTKFTEIRQRLSQGVFDAQLIEELECRAGRRTGSECDKY